MAELSLVEFADKLSAIFPVIVREFVKYQANELYKGKITLPQFLILDFLYRQKESRMTALAGFMKVTTAAVTGLVDRLVRDGYVIRTSEPADRRVVKIKLTPKGSSLVKKINEQRHQMIIKIFGRISASDRQDYLRILMQIHNILTSDKKD